MKKKYSVIAIVAILAVMILGITGCSSSKSSGEKVIKVAASPTPHAEILEQVKDKLAKEGYKLEIVTFDDYVMPNQALEEGEVAANYFQNVPFMENYNKEKNSDIVSVGAIHFEPLGIYPGKTKSLKDLKDGAEVAIPNDAINEARALLLLEQAGLITLKKDVGLSATISDIESNTKNLNIKEVEGSQLVRSLPDVDIAVINGNYALDADMDVAKDSLLLEKGDSAAAEKYANIVSVKKGHENDPEIKALVKVLQSQEVKDFINERYKGGVIPVF